MNLPPAVLIYLLSVNFVTLFVYGLDKYKAKAHAWRIPERTLWLLAFAGGAAGAYAGMSLFHHKTKHPQFKFGIPILLILQVIAGVALLRP